jgi:multicomponent Na+:H+ antiporter subunit D
MSAFTTKTAVYTLARAFSGWEFLAVMGVAMTLYGVVFATMENNARRILSYHIVSQVGFMVAGIGIGTAVTVNGATAHAYAHILYKGLLFMSVGAILYSAGTAKLTELGGLAGKLPLVMLLYVAAGLSISGWPLFNGFISKTMTIAGAYEAHRSWLGLGMELAAVGTFLSVGIKLPYFAFWGGKEPSDRPLRPIPGNMYLAMGLGALLCFIQGVYPPVLYALLPNLPVEYQPWTAWHVLQVLLLLSFTGLAFFLMRRTMRPHAQLNLDFDFLYRRAGRGIVAVARMPIAALDALWSEAYRVVGLWGLMTTAKLAYWFDRTAIDGVVDGTAEGVRRTGGRAAMVQSGKLQEYLLGAVLAAGVILLAVLVLN